MFASHARSRATRRGVVLVVILGMLGLLALIGVTFATFSNQAQINARNFSQSMSFPDSTEMFDYALSQLIDDTANPQSVIRGHSLKRDMYGNDAYNNGALLNGHPTLGTALAFSAAAPASGSDVSKYPQAVGLVKCVTNISSADPAFYGYDFTRWVVRFSPVVSNPLVAVARTLEVIIDDPNDGSGYRAFYVLPFADANGNRYPYALTKQPANDPSIAGYQTPDLPTPTTPPGSWTSLLTTGGSSNVVPLSVAFSLDGRFLRAFNGPGMSSLGADSQGAPMNQYANFRYNGNILVNGGNGLGPFTPAFGDPNLIPGMDEDYDAVDLENWFLAVQTADGQVVIPSFHRPGILTAQDWNPTATVANGGYGTDQIAITRAYSKLLRPRAADGHDAATFPNLLPTTTTGPDKGKLKFDVDNDGDGHTDAVWLDLGYPPKRTPTGQLFKPLFAFTVIGLNGKLPLNTGGNLAKRSNNNPAPAPGYKVSYKFDHADHLGYSPSEVDLRFALQNAFDTDPLQYSPVDNAGVNVATTQLRNLLSGTRPPTALTNADTAANGDANTVPVGGQAWFLPNGMSDAFDVQIPVGGGGTQVMANTQSVAGRWGEEEFVPSIIPGAPTLVYTNPVRAGHSVTTKPFDATDDNFNTFDVYAGGLPEQSDYHDWAGGLRLPVERYRRFLYPLDLTGDGRITTWNADPNLGGFGGDVLGRVVFFRYFRPPGRPQDLGAGAAPNTVPTLGTATYKNASSNLFHGIIAYSHPSTATSSNALDPLLAGAVPSDVDNTGAVLVATPPLPPPVNGGTPDITPPTPPQPTFTGFVNSKVAYLSQGLNEADEMNLYLPTRFDAPFGPSDLEWLYRFQDVDGPELHSRLDQLAPVSFLNPRDGGRRRRLFALDSWDTNSFTWANDNPAGPVMAFKDLNTTVNPLATGQFPNNSRFLKGGSASFAAMNSVGQANGNTPFNQATATPPTPPDQNPDPALDFEIQVQAYPALRNNATPIYQPVGTPSVAHRDRRINLNFPLPVSNSPSEPVRQKWVRETYEFLKATLPPRSVDTPEELARLSQYVVNLVDYRDTDCASTKFVNTDLWVYEPNQLPTAVPQYPQKLVFTTDKTTQPAPYDTMPKPVDPAVAYDVTYTPPVPAAAGTATGHYLVQHGMEYPPVAINEVLAVRYYTNRTGTDETATNVTANLATEFAIELVNTLNEDATAGGDTTDLDLAGWDVVIMPDNGTGRPDPVTGELPISGDLTKVGVYARSAGGTFDRLDFTGATAPAAGSALANKLPALRSNATSTDTGPWGTRYFYTLATPAPAVKAGIPLTPAITPAQTFNLDLTKDLTTENQYYWVYLRRPPNPYNTGYVAKNPFANRIVVDSFRFVYTTAKGRAHLDNSATPSKVVQDVNPAGDRLFSLQRQQPYRGGQAVPPLNPIPGAPAKYVDTAYGFSEQTSVNTAGSVGKFQSTTGTPNVVDTTTTIFHTLGARNNPNDNAWDFLPVHDRDFMGVVEMASVPGCAPGLFTKQFVEQPPPIQGSTPVTALPLNASSWPGTSPWRTGTVVPVFNAGGEPHSYPYLRDEFYYTAANEWAPQPGGLTAAGVSYNSWPQPATGPTPFFSYNGQYIGGPSGAGWFKMFEFFEVPSAASGSTGSVSNGVNYDWARQDVRPGLINLNLVVDEEVFLGLMGEYFYGSPYNQADQGGVDANIVDNHRLNNVQLYKALATTPVTFVPDPDKTPRVVTQVNLFGQPTGYYQMPNVGATDTFTDPTNGTQVTSLNAMKGCFSDFLKLRSGGSGYVFGYGRDQVGAWGQLDASNVRRGLAPERPFHAPSYPDISLTIMRPAALPPSTLTDPPFTPFDRTAYTVPPDYAQDPGIKNPFIYTANNPVQPPPIPTRRLFQIPDWFGSTPAFAGTATNTPSNASTTSLDNTKTWLGTAWPYTGDPYVNKQTIDTRVDATTPPDPALYRLSNPYMDISQPRDVFPVGGAVAPRPAVYLGRNGAAGTQDHSATPDQRDHPYFRNEMVQKLANLTTVRTHQYAVWITVGFFEVLRAGDAALATVSPAEAYDILGPELGVMAGRNIRYRGFFLIDRTKATGFNPSLPGDFRDLVVYRQLIE